MIATDVFETQVEVVRALQKRLLRLAGAEDVWGASSEASSCEIKNVSVSLECAFDKLDRMLALQEQGLMQTPVDGAATA